MTEQDILQLIEKDAWMMRVLRIAEELDFPDWVIGAGFVRNAVWDYLHGYAQTPVHTNDIDLVYFNPSGNDQHADEQLSQQIQQETGIRWEIVNQAYAHKWNTVPPYRSATDALSQWPETATCVGVRLKNSALTLVAPHGISDLVQMIVRPSPSCPDAQAKVKERMQKKGWKKRWPKLRVYLE